MSEFEFSDNFVEKVMEDVRSYERTREVTPSFFVRFPGSHPARWALSAAGVLLGTWNFIRLYLAIVAPVVCR